MPAQDNATLARTVYDAFNRHEFDRALEYVGDSVEIVVPYLGLTLHGLDGFRTMLEAHKAPWPDGTVEVVNQLASDDGVTNECRFHATNTRPVPLPDGSTIPATGKRVELHFCEVWRIESGRVVSLHSYADNMEFMQQAGLMPAAAPAGA